MPSGHKKPVAELVRDTLGTPVLYLYHLKGEQLQRLHDIMLVNGTSEVHNLRSMALAHLGEFDTHDGRASVFLHGEDTDFYTQFNAMLSSQLGIIFPNMPAGDYRKLA